MSLFGEVNAERIQDIVSDLRSQGKEIENWLVKALILEYLPCRRFLEGDTWVLIDYNQVTTRDIEAIVQPYVLLNGVTLIHNITEDLVKDRLMGGFFGTSPILMPSNPSLFVVEGQVSKYHFPYTHHVPSVVDCDWKLKLNRYEKAVVVDGSDTFQWTITTHAQGWYISNVFSNQQLQELHRIHDEIHRIGQQGYPTDTLSVMSRKQELERAYGELETLRGQMRATVFAYHQNLKTKPDAIALYTEDAPPKLTLFDDLDVKPDVKGKNRYFIRTYVEPLYFRSASRAADEAEVYSTFTTKDQFFADPLSEEIEASAESIMFSVMCLEAYINGFARDHSTLWTSQWERTTDVSEKWLVIPDNLGNPKCFDKGSHPYQYFVQMVKWRNDYLAHYKHTSEPSLHKPPLGYVSNVYSIFNAKNARKATSTVIEMIQRINVHLGKQMPSWVQMYLQGRTLWLTPPKVDKKRQTLTYGTPKNDIDSQIEYLKEKIAKVLPLLGQSQAEILHQVWHVDLSEQEAYQEAEQEYKRMMQLIAAKCGDVLKKQGLI